VLTLRHSEQSATMSDGLMARPYETSMTRPKPEGDDYVKRTDLVQLECGCPDRFRGFSFSVPVMLNATT
jgi:hypothetical protein